jgi:hypothetical protein
MLIELYTCQRIPTALMLSIDKKSYQVKYRRNEDNFGYTFEVVGWGKPTPDVETAKEIVSEIVKIMCDQSYDHGAEWRMTEISRVEATYGIAFDVRFRIKDSF